MPLVMSFIVLCCAVMKRYWQVAAAMIGAAMLLAWLASLSVGPYLWPAIGFMGWSTARIHDAESSATTRPAPTLIQRVFFYVALAIATLIFAMLLFGVLGVIEKNIRDYF